MLPWKAHTQLAEAETHFEARVVASGLTAVLCETSVRGLIGDFATAVQTQRASFGTLLDDVIVAGIRSDGRPTSLDPQIKNRLTFTENDKEWFDVLQRAWDTFTKATFNSAVQRFGVGIGTYNGRVDQHYQAVLRWAEHSSNGNDFLERIQKADYSHNDRRGFVETVQKALTQVAARPITPDELKRFLASFVIVHFDFQSGNASRDEANAIDRIRSILAPDRRGDAESIWNTLVAKCGELIPSGGSATRSSLANQLTQEGFALGPAPSFWKDIVALNRESARALGDIKSDIHGFHLHRNEAYQDILDAMQEGQFIQIDGEPGVGKSALLKELALDCERKGPILVLKDTRIQPRGWASHARTVGISTDLSALLREFACGGNSVLFIDGIDKVTDPAIQLTVNDIVKTIADNNLTHWKIVVTVREQNLKHFETWLDPDALAKLRIRTVTTKPLDHEELRIVSDHFPRLRPLLSQGTNADLILNRPFFLDAMLRLASCEGMESLPATEVELLKSLVEIWWLRCRDATSAQHRRNLLIELAAHLAVTPGKPLGITTTPPEIVNELKSAGILRDKDLGLSIVFTHDIYEEWVLCQLLINHRSELVDFIKCHRESDALIRPLQLLGTHSLETNASSDGWRELYEVVGDESLRPVWQRTILTSSLQSKELRSCYTVLNPSFSKTTARTLRECSLLLRQSKYCPILFIWTRAYFQTSSLQIAPSLPNWCPPQGVDLGSLSRLPIPLVPSLPSNLMPALLPVFLTWQVTFGGTHVRHCKEIGILTHAWLLAVETANHSFSKAPGPFGGAVDLREIEKPLREIFLTSAGDVPSLCRHIFAPRRSIETIVRIEHIS